MNHTRKKSPPVPSVAAKPMCMVRQSMFPVVHGGNWFPATDVYETAGAIIVHMDVSGMDPQTLSVVTDGAQITVSGERGYESLELVSCIHQLEIERGFFERSILLPKRVEVSKVISETKNGFLQIILPLRRNSGKIKISVK